MTHRMTEPEIRDWLTANLRLLPGTPLDDEEVGHIAKCLHHIHEWYYNDYPIGEFLGAVVTNNFTEACFQADDINKKALYIYALFLANKLPGEWRRKARGEAYARQ